MKDRRYNIDTLTEHIWNLIEEEKVTTPWRIQERLGKNIITIYKILLILLKEGKIDVDVLDRNVIIRYKETHITTQVNQIKNK